jgi:hypothetical protein
MLKQSILDKINFNEELKKMLSEDSDKEEELCLITGNQLDEKYSVKLECNHMFNYEALYKEIIKQKYDFKTYHTTYLSGNELIKFRDSKKDYFIKCPYCRCIQFSILPYYEELKLDKRYGVNTLDKTYNYVPVQSFSNHSFTMYGNSFTSGQCSFINIYINNNELKKCNQKYVAKIPNCDLSYCKYHYRIGLKKFKLEVKNKLLEEKNKLLEAKKKIQEEKIKKLEELNIERLSKGLKPLKRLPIIKKVIENVVQPGGPIAIYNPNEQGLQVCQAILKSGVNKGNICGCKIFENQFCKRHSNKKKPSNETKEILAQASLNETMTASSSN